MGNRARQPQPPAPPAYKCCSHQQPTYSDNKCSRFKQYIDPCCIHLNTPHTVPSCLHIKQFPYVLAFNAFQLGMLLAYVFSYVLPTVVVIPCGLICLMCVYFRRDQRQYRNMYLFFVFLGGLDLVSEILVAIVPPILISYQLIILAIISYVICNENNKKKSSYTTQKPIPGTKTIRQAKIHEQSMILEEKCCICLVENCQYVLLPCKHASYCRECVLKINQCSLCRVAIKEKVRMKDD